MNKLDNQCNFSTSHYIQTLKNYQKTHNFCFFDDCSSNDIILRHDIDFSLQDALRIAKIENELGIKYPRSGNKIPPPLKREFRDLMPLGEGGGYFQFL